MDEASPPPWHSGLFAVQIGTAFLFCPEAAIGALHRKALRSQKGNQTAITNVFTGWPARAIVNRFVREAGPINGDAPDFPLAAHAIAPLRLKSEAIGSTDFSAIWSGQAGSSGPRTPRWGTDKTACRRDAKRGTCPAQREFSASLHDSCPQ
jgi:nitronate monooxygenase